MPSIPRTTLAAPAVVRGRGLFSGRPSTATILPAPPGTGLAFRTAPDTLIPATTAHLAPPPRGMPARNTILAAPPATILTVEHILSALVGLGITDAIIEIQGPEVPIGDGSAAPFTNAISAAGTAAHATTVEPIRPTREIVIEAGAGRIVARPRQAPGASYTYELDYGPGAPIPAQRATWAGEGYATQVAPARTFCLLAEAEQMRALGLFTDLSPKDMLVIGAAGPIENAYRFPDEPARHKLLDLIGDLALAGRPIQADITATRAGHALNHDMARALAQV